MTDILNGENCWAKKFFAKDSTGTEVGIQSPNATKRCIMGAASLIEYTSEFKTPAIQKLRDIVYRETGESSVGNFNDNAKFEDVYRICQLMDVELALN